MANWYQGQLRMLQTVLRETDIVGYDAQAVARYMEDTHTNVLIVNAGGIVDFFGNEMEMGHPNPFMQKEQEILAQLCEQLHARDMRVMVRVDFRGVQKYRYDVHPDWFAQNADGTPIRNAQGLYSPCYLSYYANEHAAAFITQLFNRFPLDGIWENAVAFDTGVCYCKRCKEDYKKHTGQDIPLGDETSPAFMQYREWKKQKATGHILGLRKAVKAFGEDKAYAAEVFGMYHAGRSIRSGIDTYAAQHFDFAVGVGFLSGAPTGQPYDTLSYAASAVRFLKAIAPDKPTVLLTGNNGTKWRLVKDPTVETRLWMWQAASVGGNFWNCLFNGMHPNATEDRRNAYIEKDVFEYLKRNENVLNGQMPVGEAAILFSKPTRDAFGSDDEAMDGYGVGIKGLESVLIDKHIPYCFITEKGLSAEALKGVKVLCLPNCACLSDAGAQVIREYVREGGTLLASYETSLYDEMGNKRSDFALGDVLGVSSTNIVKDTSQDCYQLVRQGGHALLKGMEAEKTRLLINGANTLLVNTDGVGDSVCSYVPIIPNQYPEQAWIRLMDTDFPTVYAHDFGKGKAVYFASAMDALVYKNGHEDFFNLISNALEYLGGNFMLETCVPDSVHINLMKNDAGYVLSCVNMNTGLRRAVKQLAPAQPFKVTLTLETARDADVMPLYPYAIAPIATQKQHGPQGLALTLDIPSFEEFLAVHICAK